MAKWILLGILLYAKTENDISEKNSVKSYFEGNTIELSMDLTISEYQKYLLRLDPTDFKGDFSIKRVTVNDGRKDVISLNGK